MSENKTELKNLILIVDDTPQNIQVLANILYKKGYGISVASSGEKALQTIKEEIPDLILLDIQMPEMDGYEVCKILKQTSETKNIPIIFLTAKSETEDIIRGFELGAVDYIAKPFNVAELTARVATHIDFKKSKERIEVLNKNLNIAYNQIKDSINYAKIIQERMLPDLNILQTKGVHHMLIYKPKDTIGGDFYWTEIINDKIFIAVADCTGHGVPGALLSMSGHNLLNEIINVEKNYDPADILHNLNNRVCRIFKQKKVLINDGMEIALCVIDTNSKTMEYAGANLPLLYFRNKIIKKLLPDKIPIGESYFEQNKPVFTKQTIEFNAADRFFMFTDGITDQLDRTNKNKMSRKKIETQLELFSTLSMSSVKDNLLEFLNNWQGNNTQTDDILLLGFEIS